ncbi:TRAF3-interacting protein 1 [Chelonus insularis]|uniref:TRAF3-interacting protein 1 n=1 Tax=Chelonus insularis TaxID=460826 RepID=UPI001588924C|nr:TRAF3-interacting protein 1 [Chelonus insularis]
MAEDIKLQESIKKTQDLLGKYIKKPPLTEKLLKKPPFRFIHDIISSVIKETGFLKNLYNEEELNSANYTDKESKLTYLTKLIDSVKLITGNELSVRASKIVSGQEPIKTNELLQAIGRALDKKVSSDEAIDYYKKIQQKKKDGNSKKSKLNSRSPSDEKSKKFLSKPGSNEKLSSGSKEKTKDKDGKDREKEKSSKEKSSKVKVNERDSKSIGKTNKEKKDLKVSSRDSKTQESKKKESNNIPKVKKNHTAEGNKSITELKEINELEKSSEGNNNINDDTLNIVTSEKIETNIINESSTINENKVKKTSSDDKEDDQIVNPSLIDNKANDKKVLQVKNIIQEDTGIEKDVKNDEPTEKPIEKNNKRARSALLRPPSARPPSARPAAPKIRNKPDFIIDNNMMTQMADINVIVENFDGKEDDADNMVVIESGNIENNLPINSTDLFNNPQIGQEHGHLVAQILETQRDLVNEGNVEIIPNKVEIEWDSGLKKDRDVIVKEIDKLRGTIQMLTRATNPLGKLFDFLQEDVEIMQRELRDCRNEFASIREQLIVERNNTQKSLKPLEESLKEVEANINDQIEKIHQTKCNIIKNDQKIARLLSGH